MLQNSMLPEGGCHLLAEDFATLLPQVASMRYAIWESRSQNWKTLQFCSVIIISQVLGDQSWQRIGV